MESAKTGNLEQFAREMKEKIGQVRTYQGIQRWLIPITGRNISIPR